MTDGELPRFCRKKLNCVITNSGTGCAADRTDQHRQKSGPLQAIAGHIPGVQCRQNIPAVATRKSMDEKPLTTEPEEEEFVVNGIYALVIGYEVFVK